MSSILSAFTIIGFAIGLCLAKSFPTLLSLNTELLESTKEPELPIKCRFNKTGVSGLITNKEIPSELLDYSISQKIPFECVWNITVQPGYKINLEFLELNNQSNCDSNYIHILSDNLSKSGQDYLFCNNQAKKFRSTTAQLYIKFFAKPEALKNFQFKVTFNAFRELMNTEQCTFAEFDCEDSTCIDYNLKCDGFKNCENGNDENKGTTCARIESGLIVTISSKISLKGVVIVFLVLSTGILVLMSIFK